MSNGAAALESSLSVLVFTLGPAVFGIDTEQLAGIVPYRGEEAEDLFWLDRLLGFREPPTYRQPEVIRIKDCGENSRPRRLIIDAPEDIRECTWREIRPLPPLVEPLTLPRGLWGALPLAAGLLLLLDPQRLGVGQVDIQ